MLVEYLPVTAQFDGKILGNKAQALDEILDDSGVLALRVGHAVPEPVVQARALSIVLPVSGGILTFDDLVVEALDPGYALYSRDRHSSTTTTLTVMGRDVMGTIHHDGAMYVVEPLGDGLTAVYLYDAARLRGPLELEPDFVIPDADPQESSLPPQRAPPMARDARGRIDVLVVYSNSVKRGSGNVDALIAQLVVRTNQAYLNSGITTRIRVVHSYETPYIPLSEIDFSGTLADLRRLQMREDGYLDEVSAKREQYGADVVILLFRQSGGYCGGGRAYQLDHSPGDAEWAFGVSGIGTASCIEYDAGTFAHEIGHIQGASHNPEEYNAPRSNPYPYGHGLCNAANDWRTVMSYDTGSRCDPRIEHFSNPAVRYRGTATGDHQLRNVARVINETAIHVANFRQSRSQPAITTKALPFVPPASNVEQQGFVRVVNHSDRAGTVEITAIDDKGQRFGPVTLSLEAKAAQHFNSQDLENGNPGKNLSGRAGDGTGNWRLELKTDLEIEHLAYIRTMDGFVTSMHQVAAETEAGSNRYHVPFFNPGRNRNQESRLRLINPGSSRAIIEITGLDDDGQAPPLGPVRITLDAGNALILTAGDLEKGHSRTTGRLGAGSGKWRLSVSANHPIRVMSLLVLPTGHITNLSDGQEADSAGTTPPPNQPDLVVQSPSVSNGSPSAGESFTFTATVHNQGTARSTATRLGYFRSSDATVSTADTRVGTDAVSGLSAAGTSVESLSLKAPTNTGTYYYGACVEPVSGESDTRNNCSSAVRVTVGAKVTYCNSGSSRYGAIAPGWKGPACSDGFGWGYAYNFLDRGAAVSRAESECRSGGLRDCEWIVVFTHCGSLAYGESSSGCGLRGGFGATRSAAEQDALSICRESYSDCEIAVGDDPGAGVSPPGEARSGRGTSDSPFGASNPEARPEAVPTK